MIAGLQKINTLVSHPVHQSVLLRDTPGPTAREHVAERLGSTDTLKRVAQDSFDEIEDSNRNISVALDPVPEILKKFCVEYRETLGFNGHSGRLASAFAPSSIAPYLFRRGSAPSANAGHSGET